MSISKDYERYDFSIKASELPDFMQKAIKIYGIEIVEIKINGYYYEIINDLEVLK